MTDAYLGLDIGATSVKAALLDQTGHPMRTCLHVTRGRMLEALRALLAEVRKWPECERAAIAATGSGTGVVSNRLAVPVENEIVAAARGAALFCKRAANLIEVGGQFTKWIAVDAGGVADYATNDLCAAGSGSFLEHQASRLRVSVEELARLAAGAARGATIAGRCSVFAKSDMIHLQQKGAPLEELAYGLCLAVARNFLGAILRGRDISAPVAFVGGGAANEGLVRAFQEVLALDGEQLFVPERYRYFGAAGAALKAAESGHVVSIRELRETLVDDGTRRQGKVATRLKPLHEPASDRPAEEPAGLGEAGVEAFLGADVGSVSTNLVLLTREGEVVDSVYLPTRGRPVAVLSEGLKQVGERYGGRLRVLGVGTTGSGRHLAGAFLGADVTKNEITAQLSSTAAYFPKVDTIFEIGGQDSKYIRAREGSVVDFTMNKVCAAGTGSFLEEQAERLGIRIVGDFETLAMAAAAPADLGSRCTVFMDSELTFAQQRGVSVEDLAAGLAYAIARNYLEKVVAGRPVGDHVVFQGGVASNRAVVAAFESILGLSVHVHPYNRVSGAIGAALLAKAAYDENCASTQFRGFDALNDYTAVLFTCDKCPNQCQVTRFEFSGEPVYFGDTCERYSGKGRHSDDAPAFPDLFGERERLWAGPAESSSASRGRGKIGVPRASLFHDTLPFWRAFFDHLGFRTVLSAPSSPELLAKGLRKLPVETCLPIKVTFGHVLDLAEQDVECVFLPSVRRLPTSEARAAPCLYGEHVPYMVNAAAPAKILCPEVDLQADAEDAARALQALGRVLGAAKRRLKEAWVRAHEAQQAFGRSLEARGAAVLRDDFDHAYVIIGRPYNLYDPFQNVHLAAHLKRLGMRAIPLCFLPLSEVELGDEWDELLWKFSRDTVRAVKCVARNPRLFPIVLTNFGCGPDGFLLKPLERMLESKPHLILEFDEHQGEAGLVTRLEAFADEVQSFLGRPSPVREGAVVAPTRGFAGTDRTVFIPHFADHAYAFSGSLRNMGYRAEVLRPPDAEAAATGQAWSSGKECHPYVLMAGDALTLARSGKARRGDVFFFPGALSFPCLISQFNSGYRHTLAESGLGHLEVATPPMSEIIRILGLNRTARLWRGLLAIDALVKMCCQKRPYENHPGATNRAHWENLRDIEEGLEKEHLEEAVGRCLARMEAIDIVKNGKRPVVGIAGDIYTRINEFSNDGLFARLEALGCEVWPAPFLVDAVDFVMPQDFRRSVKDRRLSKALGYALLLFLKEHHKGKVHGQFDAALANLDEPAYREVIRLAAPYLGDEASFLIVLNLAKMVDFARKGAHGIVNAMGFNCMVGAVSAAMLGRIRTDHNNVPVVNLVYGETDGAAQRSRLEAFVHQVKLFAARNGMETPAASG